MFWSIISWIPKPGFLVLSNSIDCRKYKSPPPSKIMNMSRNIVFGYIKARKVCINKASNYQLAFISSQMLSLTNLGKEMRVQREKAE